MKELFFAKEEGAIVPAALGVGYLAFLSSDEGKGV